MGQGTPAIVTLARPIGNRMLLDGFSYPARPPDAPFG
jgi:hypothetical protein